MPPTDSSQITLIENAVRNRSRSLDQLVVVNYGAASEYFDQTAATFGVNPDKMRKFNAGFEKFVNAWIAESSNS
jgi:hypothetical protein